MNTPISDLKIEFQKLIQETYSASQDAGQMIEEALHNAVNQPMPPEEARKLLTNVLETIVDGAKMRGDNKTVALISNNIENIVARVMEERQKTVGTTTGRTRTVILSKFRGADPGIVHPRPTFHRKEVAMYCGGVKTVDIKLWDNNERLDIHIAQFKAAHGRTPSSAELLDIMLSQMPMIGQYKKDQFKIAELAQSIANNGVRKAPIIDVDGTLLDGNRRVAACYFILNSDLFDADQKKRAETIFVWQLTEHATQDDINAVVVSLNFEPDNKQDWSEYVKAHIIFDEWQATLAMEPRVPSGPRMILMKKDLALKFGYTEKDWNKVDRYIRMVTWSNEFEDYLVQVKEHDPFVVKHQASEYFQYFDELSKGTSPGTVAYTLNQDETFRHLVFELLFQDKFASFKLIRYLKFNNEDISAELVKARDMAEKPLAQDKVTVTLEAANAEQAEARSTNPNHRIEVFTKWLERVPIVDFRDKITEANLKRLLGALRLVENQTQGMNLEL